MSTINFSAFNSRYKQNQVKRNYDKIYAHELAHKKAGGSYAGAIVIEKNTEGIPISGHVNISMPVLDKNNPERTIEHADVVIKSALAPSDPSSQDLKVASQAKAIRYEAENIKKSKKLDYYA